MSRATCPKCGNTDVSWIRDDADCAQYICLECKQGFCYPPKTVFDHITESMETLAEKLVYRVWDEFELDWVWYSTVLVASSGRDFNKVSFNTEGEAIAATIEELKKKWKE